MTVTFPSVGTLSSYRNFFAVKMSPLSFPLHCGYASSTLSRSASSVWNTYRDCWMSLLPGSQKRFSRFARVTVMSPSPPSLFPSQTTL